MAAWETLIAEYRVAAPAPLTLRPLEPVKYADTADGAALENDWRAMTDVHQFLRSAA
ncbi:hemin transport protein HmuS [Klebsiella pneumoniae]|nr:hemin transport protein HmuS [Klebsiella pneumoniae]